jgi:hypothetical protein
VVSPGLVVVGVSDLALGIDHQHSSLLEWVTLYGVLGEPRLLGSSRVGQNAEVQRGNYASFHACTGKRLTGRIGIGREGDGLVFYEPTQVIHATVSDRDELGSMASNRVQTFTEASDLLAAEDSGKVPKEGHHDRLLAPQALDLNRLAISVAQGEVGEIGHWNRE